MDRKQQAFVQPSVGDDLQPDCNADQIQITFPQQEGSPEKMAFKYHGSVPRDPVGPPRDTKYTIIGSLQPQDSLDDRQAEAGAPRRGIRNFFFQYFFSMIFSLRKLLQQSNELQFGDIPRSKIQRHVQGFVSQARNQQAMRAMFFQNKKGQKMRPGFMRFVFGSFRWDAFLAFLYFLVFVGAEISVAIFVERTVRALDAGDGAQANRSIGVLGAFLMVQCFFKHKFWVQVGSLSLKTKVAVSELLIKKTVCCTKASHLQQNELKLFELVQQQLPLLDQKIAQVIMGSCSAAAVVGYGVVNCYFATVQAGLIAQCIMLVIFLFQLLAQGQSSGKFEGKREIFAEKQFILENFVRDIKNIRLLAVDKLYQHTTEYLREQEEERLSSMYNWKFLERVISYVSFMISLVAMLAFMSQADSEISISSLYGCILVLIYERMHFRVIANLQSEKLCDLTSFIASLEEILGWPEEEREKQQMSDFEAIKLKAQKRSENIFLEMANYNGSWSDQGTQFTLKNINLVVEKGKFYALVGPELSGRGSMVKAMMDQIPKFTGDLHVYTQPILIQDKGFVIEDTVRNNILMKCPFDKDLYAHALRVSGLEQLMPSDKMLISFNQPNAAITYDFVLRLQVARGLYNQRKLYIFDSGISTDQRVVALIIRNLIQQGLTVIKICSYLTEVAHADYLLIMNDGAMTQVSNSQLILEKDIQSNFIRSFELQPLADPLAPADDLLAPALTYDERVLSQVSQDIFKDQQYEINQIDEGRQKSFNISKVIKDYFYYSQMSKFFIVICIFFALSEIGFLFFVMSFDDHIKTEPYDTRMQELNSATIIIILCAISGLIKLILTCHFILKTNGNFHYEMVFNLVNGSFKEIFQITRDKIVNRFLVHLNMLDSSLISYAIDTLEGLCMLLVSLVYIFVMTPYYVIFQALLQVWNVLFWNRVFRSAIKEMEVFTRRQFNYMSYKLGMFVQFIPQIKSFGIQDKMQQSYQAVVTDYYYFSYLTAVSWKMSEFTISIMSCLVTIIGIFLTVNLSETDSVGTRAICILLLVLVTDVIYVQQRQFVKLSYSLNHCKKVFDLIDLKLEKEELINLHKSQPRRRDSAGLMSFQRRDSVLSIERVNSLTSEQNLVLAELALKKPGDSSEKMSVSGERKSRGSLTKLKRRSSLSPKRVTSEHKLLAGAQSSAKKKWTNQASLPPQMHQAPERPLSKNPADKGFQSEYFLVEGEADYTFLAKKGQLMFKAVSLLKKQKEKLLDSITFQINSQEKVAFIGNCRHHVLDLILRVTEYTGETADMKINDIEVRKIDIEDLRSKIAFIPKNPSFVTGTLRINLDPQNEYTVKEIFDILDICRLKQLVEAFPDLLQTHIISILEKATYEQRYLLHLARALLKHSKLLVMDEPPISLLTNETFTYSIQKHLAQTSVLVFTNRLDQVLPFNRVIVVNDGRIVEDGVPYKLLTQSNKGSHITENTWFASIVKQFHPTISQQIFNIAKETYSKLRKFEF